VKGDGVGGEIDTDVVFCAGLISVPGDERCAGLFVEFVFLMRGPVRRHEDLQTGDEIAEASFASGSGDFLPIADEFQAGIGAGGGFLDQTVFCAGELVGRDPSEIGGARFEGFFERLAKFVAAAGSMSGLLWLRGRGRVQCVVHEIGRAERIDDEVDFRGAVGLFRNFEMQRTLTDVRAFGGSGLLAIGRAGIDVAIIACRLDIEVPRRTEEFQSVHGPRIPVDCGTEGNLSVADQHGDVVGPRGRGTRNFCEFAGCVRKPNGMRGVSAQIAEIDGGPVEDVLDVIADLIFALRAGGHRNQEEQDKEEASVRAFHMNADA
jgi:hypothetical protein